MNIRTCLLLGVGLMAVAVAANAAKRGHARSHASGHAQALDPSRLRLPGSSVSAVKPNGWQCATNLPASSAQAAKMTCIPPAGHPAVYLTRMTGADAPSSLNAYAQSMARQAANAPTGTFIISPSMLEIGGHAAVNSAWRSHIALPPGAKAAPIQTLSYVTVVEDHGAFYRCSSTAAVPLFTDALRTTYEAFCRSIDFAAR